MTKNGLNTNELTDLAYEKVKEMILSNELKPGQKIVQDSLALDLGISRTPLRSALQKLEAEYLIKSIPRRGVVVREFSNEKIVEIYDCRIALESMAIRLFTESASVVEKKRLQKFFSKYSKGSGSIDTKAYQADDAKFHDFIQSNCGNEFLGRLFNQGNLLICINQIGLIRPPEETLPEHLGIIEAICNKEVDKAEELGRQHLLTSKELIMKRIEAQNSK